MVKVEVAGMMMLGVVVIVALGGQGEYEVLWIVVKTASSLRSER
jgi:hypothetical protein